MVPINLIDNRLPSLYSIGFRVLKVSKENAVTNQLRYPVRPFERGLVLFGWNDFEVISLEITIT